MGDKTRARAKSATASVSRKSTASTAVAGKRDSGTRKGVSVARKGSSAVSGVPTAAQPHRATSQSASQILSSFRVDQRTMQRVDSVLNALRGRGTLATQTKKKAG